MKRFHVPMLLVLWSLMAAHCLAQGGVPTPLPTPPVAPAGPNAVQMAPPSLDHSRILKQKLQNQLSRRTQEVHIWSMHAYEQIALSLIVGLLGLAVGVVHGADRKSVRVFTVWAGFTVSAITLITNKVYQTDYHTLLRCVGQANVIIQGLQDDLLNIDPTQSTENLNAIDAEFQIKCQQIDKIGAQLSGEAPGTDNSANKNGSLFGMGLVYADSQKGAPDWVQAGKQDDNSFMYFVGQATNASLIDAKEISFELAVDHAAHRLRGDVHGQNTPEPTPQLVDLVKRSAEVGDTWYAYDRTTRLYTYYTLLRLPNGIQTLDIKGFDPEKELGLGIGPFHFGMTAKQLNALLPHPFGSVASLPVAEEFETAEVRYFWVNTTQLQSPASPGSAFASVRSLQVCWEAHSSYVTFLFAEDQLMRISVRFFEDCPNRSEAAKSFADSYFIPQADGTDNVGFRRILSRATVEIVLAKDFTAVDVFKNGAPAPDRHSMPW